MSQPPLTIPRQPQLHPAEDFFRLRREAIGLIEQLGSQQWTDYNLHDPGITILEALCYAITDLAYRLGWDIRDLLMPAPPAGSPAQPFPNQAFFTARQILTIRPVTADDFRRLLIDLDQVRNVWVFCKQCACDTSYYAWCADKQLRLAYQPGDPKAEKVAPRGLYDILLELEADPELGDLNDRKITRTLQVRDADLNQHPLRLELRFPAWDLVQQQQYQDFIAADPHTQAFTRQITNLKLLKLSRSKTEGNTVSEADLVRYWREVFYASLEISFDAGPALVIDNAALRLYGDEEAKGALQVKAPLVAPYQYTIEEILCQLPADPASLVGFIPAYRRKLQKTAAQVAAAKARLQDNRNLGEDYCRVRGVEVQEVTVCADVEAAPGADLERVQARVWFEIEQYLNPPVSFYTLAELLEAGTPVEEIFNGPALENGFLKAEELAAADLKTVLRSSDLINRLMDIEGVVAVNNLLLAKYDADGNLVKGAADPVWNEAGQPVFDPARSAAQWLLFLDDLHQPRLHHGLSRFLFFKNGLPFLPRPDEAYDTLTQLRGEAQRPKVRQAPKDLAVPAGQYRNPNDYYPLQYSFPETYGIGLVGLPAHASPLRRAQAKQLKAYLLVFEQLLGNALAQVAHTADLFSLDPVLRRTYFTRAFTQQDIQGYDDLVNGLSPQVLDQLTETEPEFLLRRNQFLDHLLARFGEHFGEYALLLTNLQGQRRGLENLIADKISFLKNLPLISHDRGKAFNYTRLIGAPDNVSGLERRIGLLLGFPDLAFTWLPAEPAPPAPPPAVTLTGYQLRDQSGQVWLEGDLNVSAPDRQAAEARAFRDLIGRMVLAGAYATGTEGSQFRLRLQAANGDPLGWHPQLFGSRREAEALRDELVAWSSQERALVVEHLLLRPKFPGDALYPACTEGACETCGAQDPYSFRLTWVMPGWTAPFSVNLEMRRFADQTIRQETPSHLLAKICWVGNEGFIPNPCDPVVGELARLLESQGLTAGGTRPGPQEACACADTIYTAFSQAFANWYAGKTLDFIPGETLKTLLEAEFAARVVPAALACTTVLEAALWQQIQALLVPHFVQTALSGWQFERFENAWYAWLQANAAFDWTGENLQARVEALLQTHLAAAELAAPILPSQYCACARDILARYGTDFYQWLETNFMAGTPFADFTPFTPGPITLCADLGIPPGSEAGQEAQAALIALLQDRYGAYKEVSYRLWVLVHLLSKLRNTYPGATLHDCDEGSDQNPVRLDSTALGNYPLRRVLAPAPEAPPGPSLTEAPGASSQEAGLEPPAQPGPVAPERPDAGLPPEEPPAPAPPATSAEPSSREAPASPETPAPPGPAEGPASEPPAEARPVPPGPPEQPAGPPAQTRPAPPARPPRAAGRRATSPPKAPKKPGRPKRPPKDSE